MKRMLALLCLTGCVHTPGSANGMLSEAELALVEGCCLKEALGFENLARSGAQNALAPESPRSIGGQDFQQRLLYACFSGEFYGVSFTSGPLEDQERSQEAALGIYAQMVEAYAHPKDGYNGALGLTSAHWTVGSMTDVAMGILLVEDRYYVISLDCGLQTVVDGQPLDAESLKEGVRGFQAEG